MKDLINMNKLFIKEKLTGKKFLNFYRIMHLMKRLIEMKKTHLKHFKDLLSKKEKQKKKKMKKQEICMYKPMY